MTRLQIARNIAKEHMEKASEEYKRYHDMHSQHKSFEIGHAVLLEDPHVLGKNAKLVPKYTGPHIVTNIVGYNNVEILQANGNESLFTPTV